MWVLYCFDQSYYLDSHFANKWVTKGIEKYVIKKDIVAEMGKLIISIDQCNIFSNNQI